ncbi:MAG: mechanosensitive ion channel domain-containing protein, partial [Ferruginibacter sp.]
MDEILQHKLLEIGKYQITVLQILEVILVLIAAKVFTWLFSRGIHKTSKIEQSAKYSIAQLIGYIITIFAVLILLKVLNFDISLLLAGSAALLVGIGFGLQHLFNDFVSGIVILFDGTIKIDDVIEVDGIVAKVLKINLRTSEVLTRDDKYIVLPNSFITSNNVINWTYLGTTSRFEVSIGLSYDADVAEVTKVMSNAALQTKGIVADPPPSIRLMNFGDSQLEFVLMFWTDNVFRVVVQKRLADIHP